MEKVHEFSSRNEIVVGIDLGTTNCCVGGIVDNEVQILLNSVGSKFTPSYVMFNENGTQTVGNYAKNFAFENASNTIYDSKRVLGRHWDDDKVQANLEYYPYTVVECGKVPVYHVNGHPIYPEQVTAKLLKHIKQDTEYTTGCSVVSAVITVPAYFTDNQRQATLDAAEIADLKVLELLNEPTAAAITYRARRLWTSAKTLVIYDLGGGTFDVAVVKIEENDIRVLAIDGDTHLGGEDFDQTIIAEWVEQLKMKYGIDLLLEMKSEDRFQRFAAQRDMARLKQAAEKGKLMLSSKSTIALDMDGIRGKTITFQCTRAKFNQMNDYWFRQTIQIVNRAIKSAGLLQRDIDDVVMIGGSSKIKAVQDLLQEAFPQCPLNRCIHPDEAVAYGATVRASQLVHCQVNNSSLLHIFDITSSAFGSDSVDGKFVELLPKGSPKPIRRLKGYTTAVDWQSSAEISIFQGNHPIASKNCFLGTLRISDIPRGRKGYEVISLGMQITEMGLLEIDAEILSNGKLHRLVVDCRRNRLSRRQILHLKAMEKKCTVSGQFKTLQLLIPEHS